MRHCLGFFAAILVLAQSAAEPRWLQLQQQSREAIAAKDYSTLAQVLAEMDPLLPGNANLAYRRAASASQLGRIDLALEGIGHLVRGGLVYDLRTDSDFAPLLRLPAFLSLEKRMKANSDPIHHSTLLATLAQPDPLPEDLAYDPKQRRLFYTSALRKAIYSLDGKLFAQSELPLLALAIDSKRKTLWATEAWLPHCGDCPKSAKDTTNLLRYDLKSGAMLERIGSPRNGRLGDMALGRNGDVFVTEARYGGVFQYQIQKKEWRRLDAPGEFPSPKSAAPSPDGKTLYVADYVRGIAAIDLEMRSLHWLAAPPGVILSGIDGLYLNQGEFLGMQSGVSPPRVVRMPLDLSSQTVIEANWPGLGEPAQGTVMGNDFVFLTNIRWSTLDGEGKRNAGAPPVESALYRLPLKR